MCNIFLNKNTLERFKILCDNEKYIVIENSNKLPPAVIEVLVIINTIIDIRNLIREYWGEYFVIDDIIYTDEIMKRIDDFALKQLDMYKNLQLSIKNKKEIIELFNDNTINNKHYVINYNELYKNTFKMIFALKYKDEYDNNSKAILKYFKAIKKELLEYRDILLDLLIKKLPKNYFYKSSILEVIKKEFKNGN